MKALNTKRLFLIAFLLLIVTNIVILTGVYLNRSGDTESKLVLTERELQLPYYISRENSGISLVLLWQSLGKNNHVYQRSYQSPAWLTADKLKTLGFDIEKIKKEGKKYRHITKECFIVLEYDGEAYQEALKRAKANLEEKKQAFEDAPQDKHLKGYYYIAQNNFNNRKEFESRLYAIDTGNNPDILREKYPDRSKYIIVKGLIDVNYNYQLKKIYGNISNLSIPSINVPLQFRNTLEPIIKKKQTDMEKTRTYYMNIQHPPHFKATIAYGKRFEPWIVSIEPIEKSEKD